LEEVGLDEQRWNTADGEEGRRPRRHVAVPSERLASVMI
jgi:hypothetical protein